MALKPSKKLRPSSPVILGGKLPSGRLGMRSDVSRGKVGSREELKVTSGTLKRSGPIEISVPSGSCKDAQRSSKGASVTCRPQIYNAQAMTPAPRQC